MTVTERPLSDAERADLEGRARAEIAADERGWRARVRGVALRALAILAVLAALWVAVALAREAVGRAALATVLALVVGGAAAAFDLAEPLRRLRATRARWERTLARATGAPVREVELAVRRAIGAGGAWFLELGEGSWAFVDPWWTGDFVPRSRVLWTAIGGDLDRIAARGDPVPIETREIDLGDELPDDHPVARRRGPAVYRAPTDPVTDLLAFEGGTFPLEP